MSRTKCGSDLTDESSLTDYPEFPDGCKSFLSTHLTESIWNSYKDASDSAGISFKKCIFQGCKDTEKRVGILAGSLSAYTSWPDLFDPIILKCHEGFNKDGTCPSTSFNSISGKQTKKEERKALTHGRHFIKMAVTRNISGYNLSIGLD